MIVNKNGKVDVRKNVPYLSRNQVAFPLTVNIPDEAFDRLMPPVEVNVDGEILQVPTVEVET